MGAFIMDYLDASAVKFPDKLAFADEKREMTFSELQIEAHKIATQLILCGFFKDPIVVMLDKSPECIATFCGIAYSGNFYTPIDIDMPVERIEKILFTLKPKAIITVSAYKGIVKDNAIRVFEYEDLLRQSIDYDSIESRKKNIIDTDVLYVLFTSGSTGIPKGVVIGQKSVIDYTEWVSTTFNIDSSHIFGNQAPLYFDNSVLDIYQTLKTGATTYFIPKKYFSFPAKLMSYLNEKKINTIFWVPSVLCLVANVDVLTSVHVESLSKILFAGEVMPAKQLNKWRAIYPNCMFANLYGPTEITVDCSYYILDRNFADNESIPIGYACANTDIFVINEKSELAAVNEIGELYVRGTSLAYGYYNNFSKTQEVFVQNPLNDKYPEIVYKTGDLVKINERGELIYVSRKDFQIKHMGYRIELGEIENVVGAMDDVSSCCTVYDENKKEIVLFLNGDIEPCELRKKLRQHLPVYMLPNRVEKLNSLPINFNGKIDRVKLRTML